MNKRNGKKTGKVKWFNSAKGFGFIIPEGGGDDVFVHHSNIAMEGYRTLAAGESVDFKLNVGDKGRFALNVSPR